MRSANADPALRTEVTSEFSLGATHYRVTRSPTQDRPSPRAAGGSRNGEGAARCPGGRQWKSHASQPVRVSDAVRDLLGFDSAQFRQVIVLPQGRFPRIADGGFAARQSFWSVCSTPSSIAASRNCSRSRPRHSPRSRGDLGTTQDLLDQYQLPSIWRLRTYRRASGDVDRTGTARALARAVAKRRRRPAQGRAGEHADQGLERGGGAYAVLSARVPAVDTDRARLQAARRAAQVTPVAQLLEVARQDQTAALAANAAAGTRVASASRAADIATGALRAEQARGEARLAAQRTVAKLEAILPQARRLGVLRNGVALASTGLAAAQVALTAKAKARDAAVAAAKTLEGELELARRDGANAQACSFSLDWRANARRGWHVAGSSMPNLGRANRWPLRKPAPAGRCRRAIPRASRCVRRNRTGVLARRHASPLA
jgi:exonuclease SbcC